MPTEIDWNDAFDNMGHVSGSEALSGFWSKRAASYRQSDIPIEEEVSYGDHPRERFDLVLPDGKPKGVVIFVHGGFWVRLDKSYWTDLAEGARQRGWVVCFPSYTLAPEARISEITQQIGKAVLAIAKKVEGPIRLCGHSAGGHLVTRLICRDTPLGADVLERIDMCMSISGLHDMRPLMKTKLTDNLRLDLEEARAESVALQEPVSDVPDSCWVGGGERPEFIRQSKLLTTIWSGLDADVRLTVDGEHNHFTVLEGLKTPTSDLVAELLR